jgi:hypothetical protein
MSVKRFYCMYVHVYVPNLLLKNILELYKHNTKINNNTQNKRVMNDGGRQGLSWLSILFGVCKCTLGFKILRHES